MTRRQLFLGLIAAPAIAQTVPTPPKGIVITGQRLTAFDRINYRRLALELRKRIHYATNHDMRVGYYRSRIELRKEAQDKLKNIWEVLQHARLTGIIDDYIVDSAPTTVLGFGSKWTIDLIQNGHREFVVTYYMPNFLEDVVERPGEEQSPLFGA